MGAVELGQVGVREELGRARDDGGKDGGHDVCNVMNIWHTRLDNFGAFNILLTITEKNET